MNYIVVCPECHSEHRQPPEAYVGLFVICADCVLAIEIHIENARAFVLDSAA